MNKGQREFVGLVEPYLTALVAWKNTPGPTRTKPDCPHIFLHGGPGVGKSFTISKVQELATAKGLILKCLAYTNVATQSLPPGSVTINYGLSLPNSASYGDPGTLTKSKRKMLHAVWREVDLSFIDEISMVGPILFGVASERLSIILDNTLPFGVLCMLLSGGE